MSDNRQVILGSIFLALIFGALNIWIAVGWAQEGYYWPGLVISSLAALLGVVVIIYGFVIYKLIKKQEAEDTAIATRRRGGTHSS